MSRVTSLPFWAEIAVVGPLIIVLVLAAYSDLREHKISNRLTYSSIAAGLLISIPVYGFQGAALNVAAVLTAFLVGIVMMLPGWIGGGDVKLFMGIGAFVGLGALGEVVVYTFAVGFFMALGWAAMTGYVWTMLKNIGLMIRALFRMLYYRTTNVRYGLEPSEERSHMPFGGAILAGAILAYTEASWNIPLLIRWLHMHV